MSGVGNYARFGKTVEEENEGILVKNEGEKYRQYQAAVIAALAGTAAGTGDGWLLVHKGSPLDESNFKFFTVIMNFAALIGALVSGYLVDKIGRKQTLILAGLLTLPTWILYIISHKILISLSIGTALGGFASGAVSVAVPLYIAEISEPSVRGTLGILFYLQFIVGELFTTIEGKDINMIAVAANCILVATIFLVTFMWLPDSPYSLLTKGEEEEAKTSITFFRGPNYQIEDEFENLKQSVSKRTDPKEALKEENTFNAIVISLILMFVCRLLAMDGFNIRLYKYMLLRNASDVHTRLATFFVLIQVIGIGASAFFIEKLGRRVLLIISASIMGLCLFIFLVVFLISDDLHKTTPLSFFAIYLTAFSFGVGPVPWVLMHELLPYHHKALSCTLSSALFWFMALTFSRRFHFTIDLLGAAGTFSFYFMLCVFIISFAIFMIPETRGRNPETITIKNVKKVFQPHSGNVV